MARRVRRRSLPASKRDRRRIVLNSLSLPPPVPLSRPEDGGRYRQETSSPQEAKISARRGPGTPVGLRPPSIPGPRPTPVIASLTLFVALQPNARLQQISALSGRHRHRRLRDHSVSLQEIDRWTPEIRLFGPGRLRLTVSLPPDPNGRTGFRAGRNHPTPMAGHGRSRPPAGDARTQAPPAPLPRSRAGAHAMLRQAP